MGSDCKGCGRVKDTANASPAEVRSVQVQLLPQAKGIPDRRNCQQEDGVGKAKNVYSGDVWQKDCGNAASASAYSRAPAGMAKVERRRTQS